jgi:hypothetical protein
MSLSLSPSRLNREGGKLGELVWDILSGGTVHLHDGTADVQAFGDERALCS